MAAAAIPAPAANLSSPISPLSNISIQHFRRPRCIIRSAPVSESGGPGAKPGEAANSRSQQQRTNTQPLSETLSETHSTNSCADKGIRRRSTGSELEADIHSGGPAIEMFPEEVGDAQAKPAQFPDLTEQIDDKTAIDGIDMVLV